MRRTLVIGCCMLAGCATIPPKDLSSFSEKNKDLIARNERAYFACLQNELTTIADREIPLAAIADVVSVSCSHNLNEIVQQMHQSNFSAHYISEYSGKMEESIKQAVIASMLHKRATEKL